MNICRVSRAFFPIVDGGAQHVWGLSRVQARLGHRVRLLEPYVDEWPCGGPGLTIERIATGFGRRVYHQKAPAALFGVRAGLRIRVLDRAEPVAVIHIHGDALDAAAVGLGLGRRRIPIVQTLHGSLSRRRLYTTSAPRLFRGVAAFIVVNPVIKEQLIDLGIAASRVSVITSGIELSRFSALRRSPAARAAGAPFRLVSVGRLQPVKGYPYLIDAIRALEARGLRVSLTIVGDGPERARLVARAQGSAAIVFTGELTPVEIAEQLAGADAFALASVDTGMQAEGTPTAVMEAMAAALPVVCSDSGGLRQLIRHGENGLVVPARDSGALALAIERLAGDADLCAAAGARNREDARAKDWSLIAAEIDLVYQSVTGGGSRMESRTLHG